MDTENTSTEEPVWLPVPVDLEGKRRPASPGRKRMQLWALVLEARYVPHRLVSDRYGFQLLVPEESWERAVQELRLFENENRNWPPLPPPVRRQQENTLATLSVVLLLAIFHNLTRLDLSVPGHGVIDWYAAGSARAADIIHGEWWRAATALTLHSGIAHLGSNLLIGGGIMILLCREMGSGLSWSLVVASGVLGNIINAHMQLPMHTSVGASTGLFGAVGILAAIGAMRYRHLPRRWLLPVAAGLALLASLGTEGERTDLGAHFFGFISGCGLGLAVELAVARYGRPRSLIQGLLAVVTGLFVVFAWIAAVRADWG